MGDFRITIEAIGGHGCGRNAKDGEVVQRCGHRGCPDCEAAAFVRQLQSDGSSVTLAKLEHWPVPGAAGTTRTENAGPVDDLLTGVRSGSFREAGRSTLGAAAAVLLLSLVVAGCSVAFGASAVVGRPPQPVSIGQPDKPCPSPSPEGGKS